MIGKHWKCEYFHSGTCIVTNANATKKPFQFGENCLEPWLYIYGPLSDDSGKSMSDRMKCCEDIRDFLNGGDRPAWLNDLRRVSEEYAEDIDGTSIQATGPMVDKEPPKCFWVPDESQEAKDARARLMDRLFLGGDA